MKYQETIDVSFFDEFFSVSISDGTTIDNSGAVRNFGGDFLSEVFSDILVDFFSLFRRSGFAGSDSPDGFISNNDIGIIFSLELALDNLKLSGNNFESLVGFSLFQSFTNAEDNLQTIVQSVSGLLSNNL